MKKGFRILLVGLVVVVVGGVALVVMPSGPREPVYEGKALNVWLEDYSATNGPPLKSPASRKLEEVLRGMGTNAIPTLLNMVRAYDPPWKLKLIGLAQKTGVIEIHFVPAAKRNQMAADVFRWHLPTYDTNALPAATLEALARILEEKVSDESQWAAAEALSGFGPRVGAVVPALARYGSSTNEIQRRLALLALRFARAESAVPFLVESLQDPDPQIKLFALDAMVAYSAEPESVKFVCPAVPALVVALQDKDAIVRASATQALKAIDPETYAKVRTNAPPPMK